MRRPAQTCGAPRRLECPTGRGFKAPARTLPASCPRRACSRSGFAARRAELRSWRELRATLGAGLLRWSEALAALRTKPALRRVVRPAAGTYEHALSRGIAIVRGSLRHRAPARVAKRAWSRRRSWRWLAPGRAVAIAAIIVVAPAVTASTVTATKQTSKEMRAHTGPPCLPRCWPPSPVSPGVQ